MHRTATATASREPPIVTSVPPTDGPDHGDTPQTRSETSSKRTPLDVYSRPLVLTSTHAYDEDQRENEDHGDDHDDDALHTSDASLT